MKGKDLLNTSSTILNFEENEFIEYQYSDFDSNRFERTDDYTGFLKPKPITEAIQDAKIQEERQEVQLNLDKYFSQLNIELSNIKNDIAQLKQIPTQQKVEQQRLDEEIIENIKKLHYYADIFEHSTTQLETKVLSLALKLAQKIVQIEVSQNSTAIAEASIKKMISKVSNATKISIHLNPKDYVMLKSKIQNTKRIKLIEDKNVTIGGVVITSDIGNFDASIESKVEAIMESFAILD
jgi:flagellar assembly protein FliH